MLVAVIATGPRAPGGGGADSGTGESEGLGAASAVSTSTAASVGAAAGTGTATAIFSEDPHWGDVKLLIGPTGADGSTTITDEGPLAKGNATVSGDAQIDTGTVKFQASLQCDGTGDWISYADSDDWNLTDTSSDEFTIETWVRFSAVGGGAQVLIGQRPQTGTPVAWVLQKGSADDFLYFSACSETNGGGVFDIQVHSGSALSANQWYHVAIDRDSSNKYRFYLDGTMTNSSTPADGRIFNVTDSLGIGARSGSGGDPFNGRLEEIRITKGAARYASDSGFTVPTARYPRS